MSVATTRWPAGLAVALLATLTWLPAAAQTVYRCGTDGREYSQQPCKDGKPLDVGDERSSAQQRAGLAAAKDDARLAKQLGRERQQREAAAKGQLAAGFHTSPKATKPEAGKAKGRDDKKRKHRVEAYGPSARASPRPPPGGASAPGR